MDDLTRKRKFAEKKARSTSAARVRYDDVVSTDPQLLFNIPDNAVIVDSMVVVETAGQAGLTVDYGFSGGNQLGNDLALSAVAVVSVAQSIATLTLTEGTPNTLSAGTVTKSPRLATGTGKAVTATFSELPTAGEYIFIVEYVEYDLSDGTLTKYGS